MYYFQFTQIILDVRILVLVAVQYSSSLFSILLLHAREESVVVDPGEQLGQAGRGQAAHRM